MTKIMDEHPEIMDDLKEQIEKEFKFKLGVNDGSYDSNQNQDDHLPTKRQAVSDETKSSPKILTFEGNLDRDENYNEH